MEKDISTSSKRNNIDTQIVHAQSLIGPMVSGKVCDCIAFLRTSSQETLEAILAGTFTRKNDDTKEANAILETAQTERQAALKRIVKCDEQAHISKKRLPHTRNKVAAQRPVGQTINYIQRTFADEKVAPIITQRTHDRPFQNIINALLIDPNSISDDVLQKMDLVPPDFDSFSQKAKNIYKTTLWQKIGFMLGKGRMVYRSKTDGRSARILQFQTLSHQTRYALFVNRDELYEHETPSITQRHKITYTSFRVFDQYDALVRSQKYALDNLQSTLDDYMEWHALLRESSSREDFPEFLLECIEYFSKKKSFYAQKIVQALQNTQNNKRNIGVVIRFLYDTIQDTENKIAEIQQVYGNLLKGQGRYPDTVLDTAKIINANHPVSS